MTNFQFKPVKKDLILDTDQEFEAALIQLDEIGENWVDFSKISEIKRSIASTKNSAKAPEQKNSVPEKPKQVESAKIDRVRTALAELLLLILFHSLTIFYAFL